MALEVTINGSAVTILGGSLSVDEAIEERSTASFTVLDTSGSASYQKGQPVTITDRFGATVFAGVIEDAESQKIAHNRTDYQWTVRCTDWHYLADKRIAAASYVDTLVGDIVRDLATTYLVPEGVVVGSAIYDGPVAHELVVNYVSVADALDRLADLAGFWWGIDANKVLSFQPRTATLATFNPTSDDMLYGSVRVTHEAPKYRNRQYLRGLRLQTVPQVEVRRGDGRTDTFSMPFRVNQLQRVESSIDGGVTWSDETFGVRGKTAGEIWSWEKGSPDISQSSEHAAPASFVQLRFTYVGEYDAVLLGTSDAAVTDRQMVEGGGTGYVEEIEDAPDISDANAAINQVAALLNKYAQIGWTVEFSTYARGLSPGQFLTLNIPEHNLTNYQVLIDQVGIADSEAVVDLVYRVHAVGGPSAGSWTKAFGQVIKGAQVRFTERINIGESATLILLAQFSKTWAAGDTPAIWSWTGQFPGDALYPSTSLQPQLSPADRITWLAWETGTNQEFGRAQLTDRLFATTAGGQQQMITTVIMGPDSANEQPITSLAWYGGDTATSTLGSGILIDRQAYSHDKNALESIQVTRYDTKGF